MIEQYQLQGSMLHVHRTFLDWWPSSFNLEENTNNNSLTQPSKMPHDRRFRHDSRDGSYSPSSN